MFSQRTLASRDARQLFASEILGTADYLHKQLFCHVTQQWVTQ